MDAEEFHRVAKAIADSGEVATLEAAHEVLAGYGITVHLGAEVQDDDAMQIIALTIINTAARTFVGNVRIETQSDIALKVRGFEGRSLSDFCAWAGVRQPSPHQAANWPEIRLAAHEIGAKPRIHPWADGWDFGLGGRKGGRAFAPACVAAGGLAVSEAFSILRRDNAYAGRRDIALSLWRPGQQESQAPFDTPVPSAWLIGLGHLGQAYAWTLGFMAPGPGATLILQDIDQITKSTLSTSVLSSPGDLSSKKTRVVAQWLEDRGYRTYIVERRFDDAQRVAATEPRAALFGVDNPAARRVIEGAGFATVIDAGLGGGFKDFRGIRIRTFPGPSKASQLWAANDAVNTAVDAPAYRALAAAGADPCGVTTLATRAVGAPFVGCVAAGYVVAELIRRQTAHGYAVLDMNLRDPESVEVIPQ